jgi:MSHA biogenesis protein MshQ
MRTAHTAPTARTARTARWFGGLRGLAGLALMVMAQPALAVDYVFPGNLPPGCSGSAGTYNCGSLTLGYGDTLTIAAPKPATINFSGDFNTQAGQVNATGAAADLLLQINGDMTVSDTAVVNANIAARSFESTGNGATITGNLTTTSRTVTLAYRSRINGSVSAYGNAVVGQEVVITGDLVSTNGKVELGFAAQVDGNVTVSGNKPVQLAQNSVVGGAVSASAGNVTLGYAARVFGNVTTTSGNIELNQNAVASACVRSSASASIGLGYAASAAQVCCGSVGSCSSSCVNNSSGLAMPALCTVPASLIARYDFNESAYNGGTGQLKDSAGYTGGPFNGTPEGSANPSPASTGPARSGSPGTCGYASLAGPTSNGGSFLVNGLPVSTSAGAKTSVAFWMYWNGVDSVMPMGWNTHDLWFSSGSFGFNTGNTDLFGVASTGLASGWHHVVAVFTNGNVAANKLYIDGALKALTQRLATPNNSTALVASSLRIGGWTRDTGYRFDGRLDQFRVYNGEVSTSEVAQLYAETAACSATSALHHLEVQHASGSGLTCTPATVTVRACQDAACSSLYTGGVSGTLSATGGSVAWPATAAFSIAAGSSSTTLGLQATTTTASVLGVASSTPTASNAASCNFGSPSCTFTAADAGFVFNVPNHVSEGSQTVSVSAVRKSDNSSACTPAFASTSKALTFSCTYSNPASGSLPVRVAGTALNAAGNAAAACDSAGRGVTLAFNGNGVASTSVQYADVGQVLLSARYAGAAGGSEAGLVMTGSDSFIAAPASLTVTGVSSGPIKAGAAFAATVSARNATAAITPNFGRETAAESVTLGWARIAPSGVGTVDGSFSGSLGAFSGGSASASNLAWTEVGRGDLVARLSSNSYLGSGLGAFGASAALGATFCASQNGVCSLPLGVTATVYYGNASRYAVRTGVSLPVACSDAFFGDPLPGVSKNCYYAVTSASNGSVGDFIAHHFDVAASAACGAFTYAGQPFSATVTARNAGGGATLNFDGATLITPNFAQAVTLSDGGGSGSGLGTLSGASIAATAFSAGVAQAGPTYAFTSKATAPSTLLLRAANAGVGSAAVSSAGYTEASVALRSGRLRLRNAYGSARALLQVPVVAEHWSGNSWLLNSADNCTSLLSTSVAVSNPRSAAGLVSLAVSTPGVVSLANGSGLLSLAAPLPLGSSLTVDVALNLGSSTADQSCHASHPLTVGAAKPWLRAQNGACATSADRDPAARASFGIYTPESRKTVHLREMF